MSPFVVFQFHNGTINTDRRNYKNQLKLSFNSTTVQLILRLTIPYWSSFDMFQFHNGTINTLENLFRLMLVYAFQFHNGTINTLTNTQKKQLKMSELANNKYAFYMINYVDG